MSKKEYLITEVREQRRVLGELIARLRKKEEFDRDDCYAFEFTTRKVERTLRKLNNFFSDDFIKELSRP